MQPPAVCSLNKNAAQCKLKAVPTRGTLHFMILIKFLPLQLIDLSLVGWGHLPHEAYC